MSSSQCSTKKVFQKCFVASFGKKSDCLFNGNAPVRKIEKFDDILFFLVSFFIHFFLTQKRIDFQSNSQKASNKKLNSVNFLTRWSQNGTKNEKVENIRLNLEIGFVLLAF
jgi:hypothetical protein